MILDEFIDAANTALSAWAVKEGLRVPAAATPGPPPPHLDSDISLAWPLATGKANGKNPLDVAARAAGLLTGLNSVGKADAVKPGFINVSLSDAALRENLLTIIARPGENGRDPHLTPRRYLLEFVSANPTGPVHLASGRAASLGDSLARILRRRGHEVKTENYVNDAGRQVQLLGQSVKARYDQKEVPEGGYHGDYIQDLAADAPPEAKDWTDSDFSDFAVRKMKARHEEDMRAFRVEFDRWFEESTLHADGGRRILETLEKLRALGKVYDKDDAVWLGTSGEGSADDKDRVLIRADKRPTYFLADLAYHRDKLERAGEPLVIDIWGADHHGYCGRMREGIAALGYATDRFKIILHQLIHLFRGKEAVKMSKRSGEFVTLQDLVAEVGVDACRFFFAKHTPNAHMNFDIELAKKQASENPVYYVQYVHARIASIFREAPGKGVALEPTGLKDLSLLTQTSERALLVKLAWFPDVLRICERDLSPHALPVYLGELATLYHAFYEDCKVLDPANTGLSRARLTLCGGVQRVIADGLDLLGVSAPAQM